MTKPTEERRKYDRYNAEIQIYFQVAYNIRTVLQFQVVDRKNRKAISEKYPAISKNISAEGICFACDKKVEAGTSLHLDVFLPEQKDSIPMEGEVRWVRAVCDDAQKKQRFEAGVKLLTVEGKFIPASIFFDEETKIAWSAVLECVFGSFKTFAKKKRESQKNTEGGMLNV